MYVNYKYLAPVTAIATSTTDFIIFLLMGAKFTQGPYQIAVLIVMFRALLFGFGGDWWFIGYCILYMLLSIYLFSKIV